MSHMSHGVIIESEEEKGGHAYGSGVGVTWHPWQVITQTDMKTSAYDPISFLRKHSLLLQYQIFLMTLGKLCMDSVAPSGLLLCDPGVLRGFHQWWRMIGRCLLFKKVDLVYWIIRSLKKPVSRLVTSRRMREWEDENLDSPTGAAEFKRGG